MSSQVVLPVGFIGAGIARKVLVLAMVEHVMPSKTLPRLEGFLTRNAIIPSLPRLEMKLPTRNIEKSTIIHSQEP